MRGKKRGENLIGKEGLSVAVLNILAELKTTKPLFPDERMAHLYFLRVLGKCQGVSAVREGPSYEELERSVLTIFQIVSKLARKPSVAANTIHAAIEEAVKRAKHAKNSSFILCDALGFPEIMTIALAYDRELSRGLLEIGVNPSGKTSTFKFLAEKYLGRISPPEEFSMRDLSYEIGIKLGFSSVQTFRDFDMLVHRSTREGNRFSFDELEALLWETMERLKSIIDNLLQKYWSVLIIADHGYDIFEKNGYLYLDHGWGKSALCASCIVPAIVLSRGD